MNFTDWIWRRFSDSRVSISIGILCVAGGGLIAASTVRADAYPSISELVQYLENRYHVSTSDLARYLSSTGENVKDQSQSRLARWPDSEMRVAVVVAGDAREEARSLAKGMIALFDQIHRRSKFCIQSVEVAEDSGIYSPNASELDCLSPEHDIVMVVDASSRPVLRLLDDLGRMSQDQVTQSFWAKQMRNASAKSDSSNCNGGFSIGQDDNLLSSGTIYLRISPSNRAPEVETSCSAVLPFRILGVPSLPAADYREKFDSRLLLIMYSPDLRPGMKREEIEQALR